LGLVEQQDMRGANVAREIPGASKFPVSAISVLVITASVSLVWSHYRLLFGDEFWEMWTDRVSTIGQIIHVQRTVPVALDPLAYHILGHASIQAFGANSFALRLPALLSVLLMQVCLFVFVRRIATKRTAVFAMALPVLTYVMGYSMEGRPYGLMLGCFGLAMVCWQTAARRATKRTLALIALAVVVAVALNTQYFGILLLVPLCVAEVFRALQRKRLDIPMLTSLAAGCAGILFAVPFMKAAKEFHTSYGAGLLSLKQISWAYIWTLANHPSSMMDRVLFGVLVVTLCISFWGYWRELRGKAFLSYRPEDIYLMALAALPFFGFIIALFTSLALEPRFVIGLVIGIAALASMGLFSLFSDPRSEKVALGTLFAAIVITGGVHIWLEHKAATRMLASMDLPASIRAALVAKPTGTLNVQDLVSFGFLSLYDTDPEVRSRLRLLYSRDQEIKWNQESVTALSALHLHDFAGVQIVSYEQLAAEPGEHLVLDFAEPSIEMGKPRYWNWIGLALHQDHAQVQLLGKAFEGGANVPGDVLSVNFHPEP
jgi:4-amino-4-deoxy-L-arabinose transferase-like glycosyltransferase